ncbi:hypothetical protein [Synechococcus sp. CCAP 1479/9]|uniref:hypothetical protein n=1 Tax=Synechococcus sp. CCAP 1479/9 TaxID=1221593 RepID=UPI002570CC24|nr:hypothetical protein [Synechococcus sp. CCAP 1479/9]
MVVDGSHVTRAARLELIQATRWPQPVEWIGCWLTTPLQLCQEWHQARSRQAAAAEEVASGHRHLHASKVCQPARQEGFAAVVSTDPSRHGPQGIGQPLRAGLAGLATSISQGRWRSPKRQNLHGFSRLLDFERLTHLLQLLSEGQAPAAAEATALL